MNQDKEIALPGVLLELLSYWLCPHNRNNVKTIVKHFVYFGDVLRLLASASISTWVVAFSGGQKLVNETAVQAWGLLVYNVLHSSRAYSLRLICFAGWF